MRKCGMFSLPVDNVRARLGFGFGIYGWIVFIFLVCERRERVKRSRIMILPLLLFLTLSPYKLFPGVRRFSLNLEP